MKKIMMTLMLLVMIMMVGCSEKPSPVKIEVFKRHNPYFGIDYIRAEVTILVDKITITDVQWNKGACKHEDSMSPETYGYGKKAVYGPPDGCNVIDVAVVTDQGTWAWTAK